MQVRQVVLASIVASLLIGCGTLPTKMRAQTKQECIEATEEKPCVVEVNALGSVPEHVYTPKDKPSVIRWQIHGNFTLEFDTPAVVFESNANGVITCEPQTNPAASKKIAICKNNGKVDPAGYKYTLRYRGWFDNDPFVWNR